MTGASPVRDSSHHLERTDDCSRVDHESVIGRVDELLAHGVEVALGAGGRVDEPRQQVRVGYLTVALLAITAVGDEAEVDVCVGGEAARTEQAAVCRRSVEALA